MVLAALAVVAVLLAIFLWRSFNAESLPPESLDVEEVVAETLNSLAASPPVSVQVFRSILPSLVVVQTEDGTGGGGVGMGSGVVINNEANVLTAFHIIEGSTEIRLGFADGSTTAASVVNVDPERDIAVLAPATQPGLVVPATIGGASGIQVGDEVYAVGNPLGLVGSLSAGVVSGTDRQVRPTGREEPIPGLIQFDAAVNPGNSGGPLLDRNGRVVGIVTGLMNPTDEDVFIGLGFAVPIDVAADAAGGPAQ